MSLNFEDMTIGQLRKMTEDYNRLEQENKILKAKFPTKKVSKPITYLTDLSAERLVEVLP